MITIKRGNITIAVVQPDPNSMQTKEISGVNIVQLAFSLPYYRNFEVGDWATILGETYYITTKPATRKEQGREYYYSMTLEGEQYKLGRVRYRQNQSVDSDDKPILFFNNPFFINDTAETMMTLLLRNVQRVFPDEGWRLGFVEDTEVKNIQFDSVNCLEVLNTLAQEFETEWLVEGRTIHLFRKTNAANHVFKQGENEALYSLEERAQDNSNKVNRLYVYGGNKNLPANYRNGRQRLAIGNIPYIEGDTSGGVWEEDYINDSIFPINDGAVTAINPSNPLQFTDSNIPFNVNNVLQDGVSAKVAFQSGELSGYEFEINTFNNTTKTFTINKNTQETAIDIPSALFAPAVGDKYFVFDIRMPNELVEQAEQRLREDGIRYMNERNNKENNELFTIVCNPLYFKRKGLVLKLADSVILEDEAMEIVTQKRIIKLSRNVRNPHLYTAELANKVKENKLVKLLSQL